MATERHRCEKTPPDARMGTDHLRCARCGCTWDYGASRVISPYVVHLAGFDVGEYPRPGQTIANGWVGPKDWEGRLCDDCFSGLLCYLKPTLPAGENA